MNPLKEMQKLVSKSRNDTYSGVVVAVDGAAVSVKTSQGVRQAVSVGGTVFRVGDHIKVQGSVILGKTASPDTLPVFSV